MNPQKNEQQLNNPPAYNEAAPPPQYGQGYQQPQYQPAYQQATYPNTTYAQAPYPAQGGYVVAGGAPTQPVYAYQPQAAAPGVIVGQPDNHAGLAWFSCLCCFWPLGLVAIIKSNEVNSAYQQGDVNRSNIASRSARQFSLIAIGLGVASWIFAVIFIILYIAVFAASTNRYYN